MLTRLAASFLALSLSSGAIADAHRFAAPPSQDAAVALPIRLPDPAPSRADVRKALAKRRDHNLAAFRAYRKAGVYPHNVTRVGPLNVWMDPDGHLCAAATMIDKDGKHDLVADIARTNNAIRLLDVTEGPLLAWVLTSGLTFEEIDRIQAPMIEPNWEDMHPGWREAEDKKLSKGYAATDAWLVKHAKAGLDSAVSRLMQQPELARKLVDGTL